MPVLPWMLLVLVGYHAWSCWDRPDDPCGFCREVYRR